jgi:lipopolysaccharide cholinephosphotransferase
MDENKILEEIHQLQALELVILKDVAEVCKKHDIKFFLGEGTLLGAIRHKGFIPWDDDVDLIMERSEYERFLAVAKEELSGKYEVQHPTTVENYWSPFIKVRQLTGDFDFRQSHISHLTQNNGPYIDIFPMEYVPTNKGFKIKRTGFLIRFYRGMLSYKLGLRKPPHLYGKLLKFVSNFYSVKAIHKGLQKNFTCFGKGEKPYMATFSSYHPLRCQICKSENYKEMLWWDFEDVKMPVPVGYDEILTTIYGDYMTPPPEENRVIKHHFYSGDH